LTRSFAQSYRDYFSFDQQAFFSAIEVLSPSFSGYVFYLFCGLIFF